MIRASTLRITGDYSANYPAAEDYELFWRLLKVGKGANLPDVWLKYEVDENAPSISIQKRRPQLQSRLKIQLKYFDVREPLAWWGILRTLILRVVPHTLLVKIKSRFWKG